MKRLLASIMILAVFAGVALGAAVKLSLGPAPLGDEPDASGRAVLNYAKGEDKTVIQVNGEGLTPGETYQVRVAPLMIVGEGVALPNGKLTVHGELQGDQSVSGKIVRVWRAVGDTWQVVLRGDIP